MRHRPSSLKLFDKCAFSALHTYYGGGAPLGPEYGGYATGSAFHEYMKMHITGAEPDLSGLPIESCREAMKLYERYADEFQFNPDDILFCEEPISHGNITGTPDLVMWLDKKSVLIFDFKTAWTEQGHEYDSLGMYGAILCMNNPEIKEVILRVCLVRYMYYLEDVVLTRDECLDTWDIMKNKMKRIESELDAFRERVIDFISDNPTSDETEIYIQGFPATPGRHCDYCQVRMECPVPIAARQVAGEISNDKAALETAKSIIATKALVKEMEDNLKPWCKENGPVDLGNGESLGYNMGTKIHYEDPLKVEKMFTPEERQRIITFDKRKMDKILEKDPLLADEVKALQVEKPSSRFGLTKS